MHQLQHRRRPPHKIKFYLRAKIAKRDKNCMPAVDWKSRVKHACVPCAPTIMAAPKLPLLTPPLGPKQLQRLLLQAASHNSCKIREATAWSRTLNPTRHAPAVERAGDSATPVDCSGQSH